ncbi:hypothetical protein Droror1_Dr00020525 [Drosera rotundifolia]
MMAATVVFDVSPVLTGCHVLGAASGKNAKIGRNFVNQGLICLHHSSPLTLDGARLDQAELAWERGRRVVAGRRLDAMVKALCAWRRKIEKESDGGGGLERRERRGFQNCPEKRGWVAERWTSYVGPGPNKSGPLNEEVWAGGVGSGPRPKTIKQWISAAHGEKEEESWALKWANEKGKGSWALFYELGRLGTAGLCNWLWLRSWLVCGGDSGVDFNGGGWCGEFVWFRFWLGVCDFDEFVVVRVLSRGWVVCGDSATVFLGCWANVAAALVKVCVWRQHLWWFRGWGFRGTIVVSCSPASEVKGAAKQNNNDVQSSASLLKRKRRGWQGGGGGEGAGSSSGDEVGAEELSLADRLISVKCVSAI